MDLKLFIGSPKDSEFESTASKKLGYDKLSNDNKKIADMMSVIEQKNDWAISRLVVVNNICMFLLIARVIIDGASIIEVIKSFFGGGR